jgi:DNA-binding beta-propeller fold protein YncE
LYQNDGKNLNMKTDYRIGIIASGIWFLGLATLTLALSPEWEFTPIADIKVPGMVNEIVQYYPAGQMLLATNARFNRVDGYRVESLTPLKVFPAPDWSSRLGVDNTPTGLAVHPRLPLAMVVTRGDEKREPGRLIGFDLRKEKLGKRIIDQPLGLGPDSIGISPDGKWALVANEAEKDPTTPGSIWAMDLRGVKVDSSADKKILPIMEISGLASLLGQPAGICEPEFVAFDPQSRFAVVSCQENDAVVLVDLVSSRPAFSGCIRLPAFACPDGVGVLDNITALGRKDWCLIGIAEEGGKIGPHQRGGNCISFYLVNPQDLSAPALFLSRIDVRTFISPDWPKADKKRLDPESIVLVHFNDHPLAFVTLERADRVLALDLIDPAHPEFLGTAKVGSRPEGLIVVPSENSLMIITANEGKDSIGQISVTQFNKISRKDRSVGVRKMVPTEQ